MIFQIYERALCKECGNDFEKSGSFFGKQVKARNLKLPPIIIPDKKRALLTDKQIKESKIYGLREIQLLLRGSSLEQ